MSNTKISALTNGNPPQVGDELPIARAGSNFSLTTENLIPIVTTAGQGYFLGPGIMGGNTANSTSASLCGSTPNKVTCVQFVLSGLWHIRHVTYAAAAAGPSGSKMGIAIYSSDGSNKLLEAIFDGTNTSAQSVSVDAVLTPGVYWLAWSQSTTTSLTGYVIPNFGTNTGKVWSSYINNVVVKFGTSSNTFGTNMPNSLGTVTADGGITTPGQNVPCAIFEP